MLRSLERQGIQPRTIAAGVAGSKELARAAETAMWLFLGVHVDPSNLLPQRVAVVHYPDEDESLVFLVAAEGRRGLAWSDRGLSGLERELERLQVRIEWTEDADGR